MIDIVPIFPTAIFRNRLDIKLTDEEVNIISSIKTFDQALGNELSYDGWVLEQLGLERLKQICLDNVHLYAKEIMQVDNEMYITNSWLNITDKDRQHILHCHTNSIISGVFYVKASDSQPSISFNRMSPPFLLNLKSKEYNQYNSIEWSVPVEDNMLIIFPSSCYHYVQPNETNNKRISIAFNTFIRGQLGAVREGADLFLK